ncbi:hypothetical protein [Parvibaculum sp.]|jgi:hypothetical protein|uniref:hypothetical protein n=1 Tax=Parvibaculum sp. TaxID=2024848 RepID=UPI003C74BC4E
MSSIARHHTPPHTPLRRAALLLFALIWLGNGLWMLGDPAHWYGAIAGVSNTGPYNPHFVRDIGCAYLLIGLLTLGALRWPAASLPFLAAVTLYLLLHALLHVWDIAAARLPLSHMLIDLPGVFAPPFAAALLAWWSTPRNA